MKLRSINVVLKENMNILKVLNVLQKLCVQVLMVLLNLLQKVILLVLN